MIQDCHFNINLTLCSKIDNNRSYLVLILKAFAEVLISLFTLFILFYSKRTTRCLTVFQKRLKLPGSVIASLSGQSVSLWAFYVQPTMTQLPVTVRAENFLFRNSCCVPRHREIIFCNLLGKTKNNPPIQINYILNAVKQRLIPILSHLNFVEQCETKVLQFTHHLSDFAVWALSCIEQR